MFDVAYEISQILDGAFTLGASDIHVIPQEKEVTIKFRIDGLLQKIKIFPKQEQEKIFNYIKIKSSIDIAEKRIPQDGRLTHVYKGRKEQLRVSTMPTIWGEKIVLRIQKNSNNFQTLKDLGMNWELEQKVRKILQRPYGLFLVTGPTGSGKSTTLHALLNEVNSGLENIICLENPVEYELEGATQVEINERSGLTFASGLRASLRQDPDVIMVGEIRDAETAQLAIQSALTGHKVFSTIHTNDAASVIERLVNIGVEPFLVRAALSGALAQRLVRKPCPCNGGCDICRHTGYHGRTALYELLTIHPTEMNWANIHDFVSPTLVESGKMAVAANITTPEELTRIGIGYWRDKKNEFRGNNSTSRTL